MGDNWDIDRQKEVCSKTPSFAFSPGKACVMGFDKVVHEIIFGGPEKLARMIFVDSILLLKSVSVSRFKGRRRIWIELGHTPKRISNNFMFYPKLVWYFANNWMNLFGYWFVFLLGQ
jgi:hypothetical protein